MQFQTKTITICKKHYQNACT